MEWCDFGPYEVGNKDVAIGRVVYDSERSGFMLAGFGYQALISIISHLFFIAITWWALQSIRYEHLVKPNHVFQVRVLLILVTIAIGSTVSNFFLDYLLWSQQLPTILD